ncbi:MAG: hypothetical protein JSS57_22160 [Proteobacteria bacterium]|nr:hypothetical protein [Pseudomonadota bacterium]
MTAATPIQLHELPARMRLLANDMAAVGAAIRYFGGFGAFAEYGDMLETQSAMVARDLAGVLESMQGGRA